MELNNFGVRLNYATATTIYHHPLLPTTSKIYPPHPPHPPSAKIYLPPPTKTHHQPKDIHHHSPPPTDNFFYKKPIYKNLWPLSDGNVRNLNSRPAIAKKLFLDGPLHFYYIHQKWF